MLHNTRRLHYFFMSAKSLKIDSLDLDLENPRIKKASNQREAMQNIIDDQKVKLVNLAESIAVKGFSPIDRCLIMRSDNRNGHFTVLEGNRRILAAKLLKNPSLASDLDMPEAHKNACTRPLRISTPSLLSRLIVIWFQPRGRRGMDSAEAQRRG